MFKPVEALLDDHRFQIPYCLSWANEPWTRTWTGRGTQVLQSQVYGGPKDWEAHFQYLLPFFLDPKYLRIGGAPIFLVYRAGNIPRCREMIQTWRALAKRAGLDDLFICHILTSFESQEMNFFDKSVVLEPSFTSIFDVPVSFKLRRYARAFVGRGGRRAFPRSSIFNSPLFQDRISYDFIWSRICTRPERAVHSAPQRIIPGAFVDWDNSPRRGRNGTMMVGATPEKFERFLRKQIQFADSYYKSDLLFVNAWNEWAEGAYLEPDQRWGTGYLNALRAAVESGDY